jgi:hypothetical protein
MNRLAVWWVAGAVATSMGPAPAALVISQYIETESGTTPKGIEVWNSGTTSIDLSTEPLQIGQGTNGAALTLIAATLVDTGTLAPNDVLVIGTADIGTYLGNNGLGSVRFVPYTFGFNGDDALGLYQSGNLVDVFGTPGVDPGSAWSGNGVSTANQNIALRPGISSGDPAGWSDPSIRFQTVSTSPFAGPNGLAGFGIAPVPEPSTLALGGFVILAGCTRAARRHLRDHRRSIAA